MMLHRRLHTRSIAGRGLRLAVLVAFLVAMLPGGLVAAPSAAENGPDIFGRVMSAGEPAAPLGGAVVTLFYFGLDGPGGPTYSAMTLTNVDGEYGFHDVPFGKDDNLRFGVSAYTDGYASATSDSFAYTEATRPISVPDIVLDPASLHVTGTVRDADSNEPIAGASVSLFGEEWGDSRYAAENGEFRFYGVPDGVEFDVGVWSEGYDYYEDGPFVYDGVDVLNMGDILLQAWSPSPHFNVEPGNITIWGHEWPPNTELEITVVPVGGEDTHGIDVWTDDAGDFHWWYSTIPVDFKPGDVVTVSDGVTEKTHTITSLKITEVDTITDTVSGTAAAGSEVQVNIHMGGPARWVTADEITGEWTADFSAAVGSEPWDQDYDIMLGDAGTAEQRDDDGDATFAHWQVPNPHFRVNAEGDGIWGHEWPADAALTITIHDGVSEHVFFADANEWGDFDRPLDGSFDIQLGHAITVTDDVTVKTHVVAALEITEINLADAPVDPNTLKGTTDAPAGSIIQVHLHAHDTWRMRHVEVQADGSWVADFGETVGDDDEWQQPYDLVPGIGGVLEYHDEDGDVTHVDWHIANPHFNVDPHGNGIWGHDWLADASLTITVFDGEHEHVFFADANEWGDFGTDTGGYDIAAGYTVTVTDGETVKEHEVTSLTVTAVDAEANTVSGTADADSRVHVWVHDGHWLDVQAGPEGEWTADFSGHHEFGPDTGGAAAQYDEDGDSTFVSWHIPDAPNAPVAHDDFYSVERNQLLVVEAPGVLANDETYRDMWMLAHLWGLPMHGTVVLSSDGSFIYIPDFGFVGEDRFFYRAWQGEEHSEVAMVTITVTMPDPVTIDVQHDAAGVVFDRWVSGYSSAYSGDGYVYSRWAGTKLTATFSGTKVRWYGPKQPAYGMADVYINGVLVESNVDCYAPAGEAALEALIWESDELPEGEHTIELRPTGAKNPASSNTFVVLDRFEVDGIDPAGGGVRFDERDGEMTGSWLQYENPTYYDKTYSYSRWTDATFTLQFEGTGISWIGPRTPNYGMADVYIDGVKVATVDQYKPVLANQGWREVVWQSGTLPPGSHTLEIKPTGTKHSDATAANIIIDAFDVRD